MWKDSCVLCGIGIVMISFVLGEDNFRQKNSYGQKIVVFQNPNIISNNNLIKPTSATVEHKPGVPPHWPAQITQSNPTKRPYKPLNKPLNLYGSSIIPLKLTDKVINNMVVENTVESKPLTIRRNNSSNSHQLHVHSEKANVIDWFLGVVGINNGSSAGAPTKDCPSSCACGQTFQRVRIVGGIETMVNEYVWMTALLYSNRFYCGASLINNKYILTAAHCVNGFNKDRITAVFLDHDRSSSTETKTISRKIKNILRHRGYGTGGNYNNDIALLQLDQEIPLAGMLKPVCLPPTGKSFTGYEGIVTGWGATKEHGQTSSKLREVKVPIMSNINCRTTGYKNRITDNMMCAGFPDGQKDSCQGDSGGPLHIVNGTRHEIVGKATIGVSVFVNSSEAIVYTLRERIKIVSLYYQNGNSARAAARMFNDNHPGINVRHKYVSELLNKFMETESVNNKKYNRSGVINDEAISIAVLGNVGLMERIVSWGEGCAEANYPGVYTRVNRYISWIRSNTRDACYC